VSGAQERTISRSASGDHSAALAASPSSNQSTARRNTEAASLRSRVVKPKSPSRKR